jgi:hypothetical protein
VRGDRVKFESLRTVWKITEMRDGCVYRTKEIGEVWAPIGLSAVESNAFARKHGGDLLGSVSTKRMVELGYRTERTVKED